ncbi:MAG: sodium:solute symporter family protein [Acidobacteria bacterium]|nr:sodium:solute symporter family protein [Acidobacteriota bacterium]MCI0719475.1 sodium:solute symporter family protein [Acidobacteriota bacterium]
MIPAFFVFAYLAVVLYIGVFAFRKASRNETAEDYFLASRSLGTAVFLFSLFGTNMTAFTILGSSGHAFSNGIVTFGLMASASALVIPLTLFLIGTRLWALGKRFGFMTPVQFFRDRWECGHVGTVIFVAQAALLVPYIIIGVMGGGATLSAISGGWVPYWLGGATVALVVMGYVFFGGMRGTAWVNTLQTILFLSFGAAALTVIGTGMGGFRQAAEALLNSPVTAPLLTRERISPWFFLSYTFIPLSTIAFPHIGIFCLTARRMQQFKPTVILYPICLLAIWLPSVFLGVMANRATEVPSIAAKLEARQTLAGQGSLLPPEERNRLRQSAAGDDVIVLLLNHYAPVWLAGLLGAGIMAAVMASDSQILALSTMFTEDVFAFYGGKERFGSAAQVHMGRIFVLGLTAVAYLIALRAPATIFELAVQYAFSGYASLFPLLAAALFWKGSTKWGALASTLWTVSAVVAVAVFQYAVPTPQAGSATPVWSLFGAAALSRTPGGTAIFGLMPVVPMVLISLLLMITVSLLTQTPSPQTLSRYFQRSDGNHTLGSKRRLMASSTN